MTTIIFVRRRLPRPIRGVMGGRLDDDHHLRQGEVFRFAKELNYRPLAGLTARWRLPALRVVSDSLRLGISLRSTSHLPPSFRPASFPAINRLQRWLREHFTSLMTSFNGTSSSRTVSICRSEIAMLTPENHGRNGHRSSRCGTSSSPVVALSYQPKT